MLIGEAMAGDGPDRAHLNVVLGPRDGPAGTAFAAGLTALHPGHTPFLVVLKPGVLTKPVTLFVNKVPIADERHGRLTWGAAQLGVARAMFGVLEDGTLPPEAENAWVAVATVLVPSDAADADALHANAEAATHAAVVNALTGAPTRSTCRDALATMGDRYYTPRSSRP